MLVPVKTPTQRPAFAFLPISISGIGVRELGFVGILGFFDVDLSTAVTLSLLVFSLQIVGAAIGALFELTVKEET